CIFLWVIPFTLFILSLFAKKISLSFRDGGESFNLLYSFSKSRPRLGRERVYIDGVRRKSIETAGKTRFFWQKVIK
ncbi:hypothetical protein, partial [Streptococcus pneumoniae]|uniref:hypothetical protein n=1 Tax=Streptococcus pneumoniae TaxID=1313 RepID=UPI001CDADEF7